MISYLFIDPLAINSPNIITLAVGFAIAHETRTALVQELPALLALQTRRMPLEIGGNAQDILIVYLAATANAMRQALFFCKENGRK